MVKHGAEGVDRESVDPIKNEVHTMVGNEIEPLGESKNGSVEPMVGRVKSIHDSTKPGEGSGVPMEREVEPMGTGVVEEPTMERGAVKLSS